MLDCLAGPLERVALESDGYGLGVNLLVDTDDSAINIVESFFGIVVSELVVWVTGLLAWPIQNQLVDNQADFRWEARERVFSRHSNVTLWSLVSLDSSGTPWSSPLNVSEILLDALIEYGKSSAQALAEAMEWVCERIGRIYPRSGKAHDRVLTQSDLQGNLVAVSNSAHTPGSAYKNHAHLLVCRRKIWSIGLK